MIAALIELVDLPALVAYYRLYTQRLGEIYGHAARPDFIAAVAAMMGVLLFDNATSCAPRRDRLAVYPTIGAAVDALGAGA